MKKHLHEIHGPLEGLSLSLCIPDMLSGVPEHRVARLITSTHAPDRATFATLLVHYAMLYWAEAPAAGVALAWRLYDTGKIVQPRLVGHPFPMLAAGIWRVTGTTQQFSLAAS